MELIFNQQLHSTVLHVYLSENEGKFYFTVVKCFFLYFSDSLKPNNAVHYKVYMYNKTVSMTLLLITNFNCKISSQLNWICGLSVFVKDTRVDDDVTDEFIISNVLN